MHEHGLVVALDVFTRLIAKAAVKRVARLATPAAKIELGFAFGDSNESDQFQLIVFLE